jgi:hypothetical protein
MPRGNITKPVQEESLTTSGLAQPVQDKLPKKPRGAKITTTQPVPIIAKNRTSPQLGGVRKNADPLVTTEPALATTTERAELPVTPVKKKFRFQTSPTKKKDSAPEGDLPTETLYILGINTNQWVKEVTAVDNYGEIMSIRVWHQQDSNQFTLGMQGTFVEVASLARPTTSNKYGPQRQATLKTTVKKAAKKNHFDVGKVIFPAIRKPDFDLGMGAPFMIYGGINNATAENDGSKAPNFRGTFQSGGVIADIFGWIKGDNVQMIRDKTARTGSFDKPLYVLTLATRTKKYGDPTHRFYGLQTASTALFGDEAFFADKFSYLHTEFLKTEADFNTPGAIRDDSYPSITIFAVIKLQPTLADKSHYVKTTIEIQEAGANLTVPLCSQQGCSIQCEYDTDAGPFTCKTHGDIENPVVASRCTATVVIKTQDNRHAHTDEDILIACTMGMGQEEVYLGMTLDDLQEELDVDEIREGLKGKRFSCTLIVNKKNITAVHLREINTTASV